MADKRLLSYNPVTGLVTYSASEDGKEVIGYEMDEEPILEVCAELRKDEDYWKQGVKRSFAHYASVPDTVILRMWTEDKVNFYDPKQKNRVGYLLNTKYQNCKVTTKYHDFRAS